MPGRRPGRFRDRVDAGRRLVPELARYSRRDVVVLALPRGGVPVGVEVAQGLGVPLDLLLVRKLGLPGHEELAMGAIGEGGVRVLEPDVLARHAVDEEELAAVESRERAELSRRATTYRGARPAVRLVGRTALVVDDGIATGSTVRAGCLVARANGASRVVVAAPVAPREVVRALRDVADDVVVLLTPRDLAAVGAWYDDFRQLSDTDVIDALASG